MECKSQETRLYPLRDDVYIWQKTSQDIFSHSFFCFEGIQVEDIYGMVNMPIVIALHFEITFFEKNNYLTYIHAQNIFEP